MPKKKTTPPRTSPPEPTHRVIETFRKIGKWEADRLTCDEPTCWNGDVSFRRYRVTVELIEESEEVLKARIQKLWDECENSHHWGPLRAAAKSVGLELDFKTQHRNRRA